ncbi:MAG: MBL fold metallo-hydrolase, partial [Betaproteobacteria bacterium]|nr:MBL fold metallo-hydrolase [Betaproteobacteria bacterium]
NFLERYSDSKVLVCASHFPQPSFGRVVRRDQAFAFNFSV